MHRSSVNLEQWMPYVVTCGASRHSVCYHPPIVTACWSLKSCIVHTWWFHCCRVKNHDNVGTSQFLFISTQISYREDRCVRSIEWIFWLYSCGLSALCMQWTRVWTCTWPLSLVHADNQNSTSVWVLGLSASCMHTVKQYTTWIWALEVVQRVHMSVLLGVSITCMYVENINNCSSQWSHNFMMTLVPTLWVIRPSVLRCDVLYNYHLLFL